MQQKHTKTTDGERQNSLKRQRQQSGSYPAKENVGLSLGEPSREAKLAWDNDFPAGYQVLDRIGEGSFGTVWLGRWKECRAPTRQSSSGEGGKLVAIKRINPTCSLSRIHNEFEQMEKLKGGGSHNNVIEVHGVVRTPGGVFSLVMPYFKHDDFLEVLGGLTLSGVAAYTKSLLTALAYVHSKGVIHRDVKPRNFMYNSKTGQGVLIDFGLAEPAEKWKGRSAALAEHRNKKRKTKEGDEQEQAPPERPQRRPAPTCASWRVGNLGGEPPFGSGGGGGGCRSKSGGDAREGGASVVDGTCAASNGAEEEDRLGLLGKVERAGTTGFRAPEMLLHCRDQTPAVDVWAAGVILLCLLSRRYPVFPQADSDEMALVQIAELLGGPEGIIRAAGKSRRHIAEFPLLQQPSRGGGGSSVSGGSLERRRDSGCGGGYGSGSGPGGNGVVGGGGGDVSRLEELCAPLLGGGGGRCGGGPGAGGARAGGVCDEKERRARGDALSLLRGMLRVDPRERLSAEDALLHPFVLKA